MLNNRGCDSNDDELDGALRVAVQQICTREPPPARVDACLAAVAATISSQAVNGSHGDSAHPQRATVDGFDVRRGRAPIRRRWMPWIVASSVICGVVAVIWSTSQSVSLADVAQAVKLQKWIHIRHHGSDGKESEFWFSPENDNSAMKSGDWIEFHDDRLKLDWSFDAAEGVVYRVPDVAVERRQHRFAQVATALSALLKNDSLPEDPLSTLGVFFGGQVDQVQLDGQSIESVTVDGDKWLEYRLSIRHRQQQHPIEFAFRIHPQSRLPQWYRVSGRADGQDFEIQGTIEYPESGPDDIHALGVPRDSKFVDRIPKDDVARLVAGVNAGRVRFDNYRAIVVKYTEGREGWYDGHPDVIHRKGDRMRRDMACATLSTAEKPLDDTDLTEWWKERVKGFKYNPSEICIGDTAYFFKHRYETGPNGEQQSEIASVTKQDYNLPPDQFIPAFYSLAPEYVARPPLGIPNRDFEPSIDMAPDDGPQGTVLLRVHRTGRIAEAPGADVKNPQQPDAFRYWIEADRGFLVMRWDLLDNGGQATSTYVIEETDRSPRGNWYAKRVRWKNSVRFPDGTTRDQILDFHVDFDADIPDELFDPQKPMPLEGILARK